MIFLRKRAVPDAARKVLLAALCASQLPFHGEAQATHSDSSQHMPTYSMHVRANEVEIFFRATDAQNQPVLDLKPEDLDLFDNNNGPGQIIKLQQSQDRAIQVGVLIDASASLTAQRYRVRAQATQVFEGLLLTPSDAGSLVIFGRSSRLVQEWTNNKDDLIRATRNGSAYDPLDGTRVYDTILTTCRNLFGRSANPAASHVIMLFSDGLDNASSASIEAALDACRKSHTTIYAFGYRKNTTPNSPGPAALRQLVDGTGGRLFYSDDSDNEIQSDIDTANRSLRDEYSLLYRPKQMGNDGAFHKIVIVGPSRVASITGTSGYYAPKH